MKQLVIIFSKESIIDLKEAKIWYNLQQKGLGKRLENDIKDVIEAIKKNLYYASVIFANIRTAACNIFPYAIHYEIDEQEQFVRVISMFHFSRKPYWLD